MTRRELITKLGSHGLAFGLMAHTWPAKAAPPARPTGNVVLITGTSSGFGEQMALRFARAGDRVYAGQRNLLNAAGTERPEARRLRDLARSENLFLEILSLDVCRDTDRSAAVAEVLKREGRIDILINNVGIIAFTAIETAPTALWRLQMETNVFGPMDLASRVLPAMRAQGSGLIITVSSRVGRITMPGIGLYAASKFALEAAVEAAHYENTPQGISFAMIQPGAFGTRVNANAVQLYRDFTLPLLLRERPEGELHHRQFLAILERNFSSTPARDPAEVAELALQIARLPRSARVLRYPVGDAWERDSLERLNQTLAPFQKTAVEEAGYADWYGP
ncbi:MAG: SDR family NAD(P)-dependent oxidoreductase [Deltaproteobacteria bacterium]|nr:SDR family NAD(P)-dependent oxidoreductase [Deltaproteobacteria bacterium]